jgi:hypothetical protein
MIRLIEIDCCEYATNCPYQFAKRLKSKSVSMPRDRLYKQELAPDRPTMREAMQGSSIFSGTRFGCDEMATKRGVPIILARSLVTKSTKWLFKYICSFMTTQDC